MKMILTWCLFTGLTLGCVSTSGSKRELLQVQVEAGDSLNSIAKQFDTDWREVVRFNRDTLKHGLKVGQVLNILPGKAAVVRQQVAQESSNEEELDANDDDGSFAPKKKGLLFGDDKKKEQQNFIFPVEGRVSSKFGKRGRRFHKGIDIAVNTGTPIKAIADGEVIFSGKRRGYGGTVVLDHGGMVSLYAHCSSMAVKVGDSVAQGDVIAKSGRTGNARGAHLHFEIRDDKNRPIDPLPLLRRPSVISQKSKEAKSRLVSKSEGKKSAKKGLLYVKGN
jgi:murein DD-endopeptidase MepM/ murein hydrolase activator NlpD